MTSALSGAFDFGRVREFDAARVEAITFDFGNTLVPVHAANLTSVVDRTAAWAAEHWHGIDEAAFRETWRQERDRQFLEDVPRMREADLDRRAIRVIARLRGAVLPAEDARWDDEAAAALSDPAEIAALLRVYGDAFIDGVPAPPGVGPLLRRLATSRRLAVISNWPLAEIVERYLERAGWRRVLSAVVVSQAVGWIKPDRRIFAAAAAALGMTSGPALLHVGDDLGADVAGAQALDWQTAWLRARPDDSPLPMATSGHDAQPDLVLDRLADIEGALGRELATGEVRHP